MMEQPIPGLRPDMRDPAWPEAELRAFSWHELAVRLSAASDLRRVLTAESRRAGGSFAPAHASWLAGFAQQARVHGIQAVNPVDSGNGKAVARTIPGIVDERSAADRGTE